MSDKVTKATNKGTGLEAIWNKVCVTDPNATKEVNFGRKFTAIDPYYKIKEATAFFGPAGKDWGWEVKDVQYLPTDQVAILVRLWYASIIQYDDDRKEGIKISDCSVEQWGQCSLYVGKGKDRPDGDCMKKATTDGITKCLSYLGFSADVFMGMFDDNRYVAQMRAEMEGRKEPEIANPKPRTVTVFTDTAATQPKKAEMSDEQVLELARGKVESAVDDRNLERLRDLKEKFRPARAKMDALYITKLDKLFNEAIARLGLAEEAPL